MLNNENFEIIFCVIDFCINELFNVIIYNNIPWNNKENVLNRVV